MPRWKELPEELDPQVREFTGQLRRLVEHSGLSPAAVADRTGYSKTSWERYLHGRLLAPQGAVLALAEVTGTDAGHLLTLWELAERAWSRSEMRRDATMESIQVAQARFALGEYAPDPDRVPAASPSEPPSPPSAVPPSSPSSPSSASSPSPAGRTADPGARQLRRQLRRERMTVWVAGAAGVLLVAVGLLLLALNPSGGGGKKAAAATAPAASAPQSPPPSAPPALPAGVRCTGADCAGKDPNRMGCSGQNAVSPSRGAAGAMRIEVRYSKVCAAAWARVTGAAPGEQITVGADGHSATARTGQGGDGYTPMVTVSGDPAKVTACRTTAAGLRHCAQPAAAKSPATP
ncbi:helix-turn-helix domain-containing protein [Streptomyces celluloflavus]|uniref:helix-turn-helix domain-containing protein n=1 Tax=Streptomyces celluloflavus TaxID=58344 RepID=UPI0036B7E1EA